jgi:hypothetical protein
MKIEDGLPLNPLDEPREARVARGVALLDEKRPGWRTRVNPDTLDMADDFKCVLGQLYQAYLIALSALKINRVQASRYGFDAVTDEHRLWDTVDAEIDALTEAWRAVLTPTPAE